MMPLPADACSYWQRAFSQEVRDTAFGGVPYSNATAEADDAADQKDPPCGVCTCCIEQDEVPTICPPHQGSPCCYCGEAVKVGDKVEFHGLTGVAESEPRDGHLTVRTAPANDIPGWGLVSIKLADAHWG
jgi:hypothetical protein